MADKSDTKGVTGGALLVAALLTSGALFFLPTAPLTVMRPQTSDTVYSSSAFLQDVDARLWQDPFAAAAKKVEEALKNETRDCTAGGLPEKEIASPPGALSRLSRDSRGAVAKSNDALFRSPLSFKPIPLSLDLKSSPILLVALVPGAPYFEEGEMRRRLRYAIISALHEEGFEPENEEHIGFFSPARVDRDCLLPPAVYYEWYVPKAGQARSVLLLWVSEEPLATRSVPPGEQIARLREVVCTGRNDESLCKESGLRVIGPYSTGVLEKLCEAQPPVSLGTAQKQTQRRKQKTADSPPTEYFVYGATGPLSGKNSCPPGLIRTMADDFALAESTANELDLRGVNRFASNGSRAGPDTIILLSEHDTAYGRRIQDVFKCVLSQPAGFAKRHACLPPPSGQSSISTISYLRGLDGALPPTSGQQSGKKTNGDAKPDAKSDDKSNAHVDMPERPFGQAQLDYLRRIAAQFRAKDEKLRREGDGKIAAVGVLGNDVFDKLQLLRALRPVLPDALFFTTDYDAAFGLASEGDYTRNLIVATAYGPTLANDLQQETPPFRSVYQSSAFIATRLALKEAVALNDETNALRQKIENGLQSPRLFEINRAGTPVALNALNDAPLPFPQAGPSYPELNGWARALIATVLAGLGIAFWRSRASAKAAPLYATTRIATILILMAALVVAAWPAVARYATQDGRGELIAFASGSSAWPMIALRFIGGALAVGLIYDAWTELSLNLKDIGKSLKMPDGGELGPLCISWPELRRSFSYRLFDDGNFVWVKLAWEEYLQRERCRLPRLALYVTAFYVFFFGLVEAYGWPRTPWRGDFRLLGEIITYGLMFASVFLVFMVFDATMLCYRFVSLLNARKTLWPRETRQRYVRALGVRDVLIHEWIDLKFIADRTSAISTLIYYPFAILTIIVISRSGTFANIAPSLPVLITLIVSFVIIFGCAIALSATAGRARQASLDKINRQIFRARAVGEAGEQRAKRLEMLRSHIDQLRSGAFVPLLEQPPLRALLFPLSGLGWTALVESHIIPGL